MRQNPRQPGRATVPSAPRGASIVQLWYIYYHISALWFRSIDARTHVFSDDQPMVRPQRHGAWAIHAHAHTSQDVCCLSMSPAAPLKQRALVTPSCIFHHQSPVHTRSCCRIDTSMTQSQSRHTCRHSLAPGEPHSAGVCVLLRRGHMPALPVYPRACIASRKLLPTCGPIHLCNASWRYTISSCPS